MCSSDLDEERREVLLAIEPARSHHRLEPNAPLVTADLCSVLITYVYLAGSALPISAAYQMLGEADLLLEDLLSLEPKHELARLMHTWSACVRGLHLSYQESEPLMANVVRARARLSYSESLLRADLGAIYEDSLRSARAEILTLEAALQQPPELPDLQARLATLEQATLAQR